jgi:ribosome-binding factor A
VSGVKRSVRVAEAMREELARFVLFELKDPRVQGVVVTGVKITDDLREAKVYYVLEGPSDDRRRREADKGLVSGTGFLRRAVTSALRLRHAPELRFVFDESIETGARIEKLLSEVRESDK